MLRFGENSEMAKEVKRVINAAFGVKKVDFEEELEEF
jgi:hypothetical protein